MPAGEALPAALAFAAAAFQRAPAGEALGVARGVAPDAANPISPPPIKEALRPPGEPDPSGGTGGGVVGGAAAFGGFGRLGIRLRSNFRVATVCPRSFAALRNAHSLAHARAAASAFEVTSRSSRS